jgi:hypothetical protein
MDCEFLERVSLLVDEEMSREESEHVRRHIAACAVCRRAEQDFLLVRQEIRSYGTARDSQSARQALREITGGKGTSWWGKKIALPAPAFALMALLVIALLSWSLVRSIPFAPGTRERAAKPPVIDKPAINQPGASQADFSRYDRGERAVIYKARRTASGSLEQ